MSNRIRRELELIADALDDVEATPEEIAGTVSRLPMTPNEWAEDIRARIGAADEADRQARFEQSRLDYQEQIRALAARKPEPVRPLPEAQVVMKRLMARAPADVSANFLKYEEASAEELAEMIGALRHLLGEDEV